METENTTVLKEWTRLKLPDPDEMSPAQRRIYDRAIDFFGGPYGPRMPLLFRPELDVVWTEFGAELQRTSLPPRLREMVILTTARCWDSNFEWHAHEPMAVIAGLDQEIIDSVKRGRRPQTDEPAIGAIYDYVTQLLDRHVIDDGIYERLLDLIGPEQLVVVTVFAGYYSNVAISLAAHAAPLPDGDPPPLAPREHASTAAGSGSGPVRELYADADGAELYVRCDGDPLLPPLLLCNSLGTDTTMWEPQMEQLAEHFLVIRYDYRGHGRSDVTPGPYTLDRLGLDALAVLDAVGAQRARICGVSLGGMMAQWLAINTPGRVEGLVIANTGSYIGGPEQVRPRVEAVKRDGVASIVDSIIPRWFTPGFIARHPRVVQRTRRVFCAVPDEGYAGCCAALGDLDFRDRLGDIGVRTIVIGGEHDPAVPEGAAASMSDAIPDAELLMLDAAHLSNVEQPEAFAGAVLSLLG